MYQGERYKAIHKYSIQGRINLRFFINQLILRNTAEIYVYKCLISAYIL